MSIMIAGMNMPKCCIDCPIYNNEFGQCNLIPNSTFYGDYVQTVDGGNPYNSKGYYHSNNTLVDKHYDEIQIGSIYWEEKVEFENPEIAVLNFFEEKW